MGAARDGMAGFLCVAFLLLVPACERVSGGNPMQPLDSEPPTVGLRIRDPRNEWRETSTIIEGLAYAFDAASTTDDSLQGPEDNVNLTYRWDFGDGTVRGPGKGGPPDGLINVSHAYSRYSEYVLNLTVSDASGNPGAIRRLLIIQANASAHPDLSIVPGTLRLVPQDPIEGREVVVSVSIRNSGFGAPARDVRARLTLLVSGRETDQTVSDVQLFDFGGSPISELAPTERPRSGFDGRPRSRGTMPLLSGSGTPTSRPSGFRRRTGRHSPSTSAVTLMPWESRGPSS
ncbi:MAG TPA: PKD domain-containing protein [Thermoplasmata archaeon]|nr:PKD domain-containing protein [Thermoplasmata archaeon]